MFAFEGGRLPQQCHHHLAVVMYGNGTKVDAMDMTACRLRRKRSQRVSQQKIPGISQ